MLSSSYSSDFFSIVSLQDAWGQFMVAEHFSHAMDFTYAPCAYTYLLRVLLFDHDQYTPHILIAVFPDPTGYNFIFFMY